MRYAVLAIMLWGSTAHAIVLPCTTASPTRTPTFTPTPTLTRTFTRTPTSGSGGGIVARAGGGVDYDWGMGVAADPSGNILLTGFYTNNGNFGGGTLPCAASGGTSMVAAQYAPDQTFMRAVCAGGVNGTAMGRAIASDSAGNILVTGQVFGTVDFGDGPVTSAGGADIFIAKYSPTGTLLWKRVKGTPPDPFGSIYYAGQGGYGIVADSSGNVIVTGKFKGSVDFGGGALSSAGGSSRYDIFLVKLDATTGNQIWAKRFGDISDDVGTAVSIDSSGNIGLTGGFSGTIDFGSGTCAPMTRTGAVLIAKFASSGDCTWAKGYVGGGPVVGYGIAMDSNNPANVAVVGSFVGTANLGTQDLVNASQKTDVFIAEYSSGGTPLWSRRAGGIYDDSGLGVTTDSSNNVIVTGFIEGSAEFGTGPTFNTGGPPNVFVAKYALSSTPLFANVYQSDVGASGVSSEGTGIAARGTSVLLAGYFAPNINFGSAHLTSAGSFDAFLATIPLP